MNDKTQEIVDRLVSEHGDDPSVLEGVLVALTKRLRQLAILTLLSEKTTVSNHDDRSE